MSKFRIYMTKKHQHWTMGSRNALLEYLDGEDDEILEYAVADRDFAIILKNDLTFNIKDTKQEAVDYISYIYRNYAIYQNTDEKCYIARDDIERKYFTAAEAQSDGVFDYVYVPTDKYFIAKFGKIFGVGNSESEMQEKMYQHYRAKYTFVY